MQKIVLLICICSSLAMAKGAKHEHREHHAHVHGNGNVAIAFDGMKGKVTLNTSADSIIGFEFRPKTEQQKAQSQAALLKLNNTIADMIQFSSDLGCKWQKNKVEVDYHGTHADVEGDWSLNCQKSPINTELNINFQQNFSKLSNVEVQIMIDNFQTSLSLKKDKQKVKLGN